MWQSGMDTSKPLSDDMRICPNGRSEAVNRALSDFGIEESFVIAAARFKQHYHYEMGPSAVDRSKKVTAMKAMDYIENKLSVIDANQQQEDISIERMLIELDGCEIRTARLVPVEDATETTPIYNNPKKEKIIKWRDVRLGFARPLDSETKTFVGKMDPYQDVVEHLHSAAIINGMTSETKIIGVADGGIGLNEALKKQFPTMQFILDKSHLRDHLYETAEAIGIKKKDRPAWVEPKVRGISGGNVEAVLKELDEENTKNPNKRVKRLIASIPQKRLKIPGASWAADSINPMLALRILRANYWWEDFWIQREKELMAA